MIDVESGDWFCSRDCWQETAALVKHGFVDMSMEDLLAMAGAEVVDDWPPEPGPPVPPASGSEDGPADGPRDQRSR